MGELIVKQKFYKCAICGQVIEILKETGVPVVCCGAPMQELIAGTTEASVEKHIPEFKIEENIVKVNVGAVEHPMVEEHFIEWVSLQTNKGEQRKILKAGMKPYLEFSLCEDEVVKAVFAYCNLHGLWQG